MSSSHAPRITIDRARVEQIAKLAALSLEEDEVEALARDLAAIVSYVEELEALDTTDVPPTANVRLGASQWREDAVQPGLSHEDALAQAPRAEHDGFAVPAFVEG